MLLKRSKRSFVFAVLTLIHLNVAYVEALGADVVLDNSREVLLPLTSFSMDKNEHAALTLANGVELILVSDKTVKNSSISVTVPVGSLLEPVEYGGLARLHQKMLLLKSQHFKDEGGLKQYIEEISGENLSSVQGSYTNFSFSIPHSFYEKMIDRLADAIKYPVFDSGQLKEKVMGLHSEWYQAKPSKEPVRQHLLTTCAGDHPINHFTLGNLTTLKSNENTIKALYDYHNKYYSSNIMKVAMVSNQTLDDMALLAKKYFGIIENNNLDIQKTYKGTNPESIGGHAVSLKSNEKDSKLYVEIPIKNLSSLYTNKLHVILKRIMLDTQPGTAFRWLLENQLIEDMDIEVQRWPCNEGFIELVVDLTADGIARKNEVVSVIFNQLKLIKDQGISAAYQSELNQIFKVDSMVHKPKEGIELSRDIATHMMFLSAENVLQSEFLISEPDQQEYNEFLSNLNLENLIVFSYDEAVEGATKSAYFDTEYRFDTLNVQSILDSQKEGVNLSMPLINQYIPEHFDLANPVGHYSMPTLIDTIDGIETWYMSDKSLDYPIGATNIHYPFLAGYEIAESEVLQALLLRIAFERCETIIAHAKSAINDVSFYTSNGLRVSVHGIPDKQAEVIADIFTAMKLNNTQAELDVSISAYIKSIEGKKKQSLQRQSLSDFDAVKNGKEVDHERLIKIAEAVTVDKINEFSQSLFASKPRLFFHGGYSREAINKTVSAVSQVLTSDDTQGSRSTLNSVNKRSQLDFPNTYVIQKESTTQESAVLDLYFDAVPTAKNKATAIMFVMMVKSNMSKKESMGMNEYTVSMVYRELSEFASIGFFNKGKNKSIHASMEEINRFIKENAIDFTRMNEQSFEAIKQDVLSQIDQTIESLQNDLNYHVINWLYDVPEERSRIEVIKCIKDVTLSDINMLFDRVFKNKAVSRMNIQYRAKDSKNDRFLNIENSITLFDAAKNP